MRTAARTSHAPDGRARAHELRELGQRPLGLLHLPLVALQHDVVAAGDDADVELGLERAQVIVVAAEQLRRGRRPARGRGGA